MESKKINDNQITALSAFNDDFAKYGPQRARLNLASWPPGYRAHPRDARNCWIKVNLTNEKIITGLATQGYGAKYSTEWITSYIVLYKSKTGEMLPFKTLQGNTKVGWSLFWLVLKQIRDYYFKRSQTLISRKIHGCVIWTWKKVDHAQKRASFYQTMKVFRKLKLFFGCNHWFSSGWVFSVAR